MVVGRAHFTLASAQLFVISLEHLFFALPRSKLGVQEAASKALVVELSLNSTIQRIVVGLLFINLRLNRFTIQLFQPRVHLMAPRHSQRIMEWWVLGNRSERGRGWRNEACPAWSDSGHWFEMASFCCHWLFATHHEQALLYETTSL